MMPTGLHVLSWLPNKKSNFAKQMCIFEGVCESQVSDQIDFCCSYCHELCQVEIITAENGLHAITVHMKNL